MFTPPICPDGGEQLRSRLPSWQEMTYTGVTIMKMDAGIDTGPILAQEKVDIDPKETAITLDKKLAYVGSALLIKTLPEYLSGRIKPQPQVEEGSTYAAMLTKQQGQLDFSKSAS